MGVSIRFHLFTGSTCVDECTERIARSVAYDPGRITNILPGTYGPWFTVHAGSPAECIERAWAIRDAIVRFGQVHTAECWRRDFRHML